MKEERIILRNNRGNIKPYLERIGDESSLQYKLQSPFYYRVGFDSDNPDKCTFIDPSGGPFISLDSTIEGYQIESINSDGTITFKS